ncbi:hypothetical protein [Rhodohalobacter sp. 614A]|uniref:hypothetical protein n=1 Tax=Rhodohalobacter sp. 614A TaxID=2908649 RepID=UPI001F1FEDDF|nr:hypothetical protein [Rhodohalobacter sp. 614A]
MSGIFEQDFIMRQIQQLVQVLQKILFKKSQGLHQEAQIMIDETLDDFLDDDSKSFQSLTLSETLEVLKKDGLFNVELAYAVGDILYERAELEIDEEKSKKFYRQAFLLFHKAMQYPSVAFPMTTTDKMSHIEEKLDSSSLESIKKLAEET